MQHQYYPDSCISSFTLTYITNIFSDIGAVFGKCKYPNTEPMFIPMNTILAFN